MRNKILIISLALIAISAAVATGLHLAEYKQQSASARPEFALSDASPWQVEKYHQRTAFAPESAAVGGYRIFPFTSLGGEGNAAIGDLYINAQYQSKFIGSGGEIAFPFAGVPIDVQVGDGIYHVAFRKIFEGRLFSLTYDRSGRLLAQQEISLAGVDYPIFRAAMVGADKLYWVVYDNKKRKNYLIDIAQAHSASGLSVELPSFYPPAGSTYEMEPPVFFRETRSMALNSLPGLSMQKSRTVKSKGSACMIAKLSLRHYSPPTGRLCCAVRNRT